MSSINPDDGTVINETILQCSELLGVSHITSCIHQSCSDVVTLFEQYTGKIEISYSTTK